MSYLNSYVKKMLEEHPHGEEFKSISNLCNTTGTPYNYRDDSLGDTTLSVILGFVFLLATGTAGGKGRTRSQRKYDANEKAAGKTLELIKILDKSENSQWLATYMVDEGAGDCEKVIEMFKNFLLDCNK